MQGALPATTLRIYADLGQSAVMLDCISCGLVTSGRKQHTAYPGKNKINTMNTAPNLHYTVSQKNVPPLQLATIFTYTVRLRQFLAQMLARK